MKRILLSLLAIALLGACRATPAPKTSVQGATTMTTPPFAYTPRLAEGYQPGVPTILEQIAPQSPYGADEAIRRALQLAVQVRSIQEMTPKRIEDTMGLPMPFPRDRIQGDRSGVYWLSKDWLYRFEYLLVSPNRRDDFRPQFKLEFIYDKAHWADMPDRTELCANRQMDVAAAEKILLDNGFRMIYSPHNRRHSWSYYKEGMAGVRISFFDDIRPITNKKACIRQIRISIGKE